MKGCEQKINQGMENSKEERREKQSPEMNKRQKRRMNRIFRERAESTAIPYPEVDNLYERLHSKLVLKLKSRKSSKSKQ